MNHGHRLRWSDDNDMSGSRNDAGRWEEQPGKCVCVLCRVVEAEPNKRYRLTQTWENVLIMLMLHRVPLFGGRFKKSSCSCSSSHLSLVSGSAAPKNPGPQLLPLVDTGLLMAYCIISVAFVCGAKGCLSHSGVCV